MGPRPQSLALAHALAAILALGALVPAAPARADEPPPRDDSCPQAEGCLERCVFTDKTETPSPFFLEKVASIAPTKHHIDTVLGPSQHQRLSWLQIVNVMGLPPEVLARWQQNRRYAGPCSGLVAVFYSKAVEDADDKNVVELYELRYGSAAAAQRVQSLMTFERNWDWNYHPFSAAYHDRSVFVVEGRWRAWSAFKAVAAHFGAPIIGKERPAVLPPCGPTPEGKPIFTTDDQDRRALAVFALGFSPNGRLAWLEQRLHGSDRDVEWSLHVVDLINDRSLPGASFRVARGVQAMCSLHGAEVTGLLHDAGIVASDDLTLEQPTAGRDPTGMKLLPNATRSTVTDVVLYGAAGEKKIGALTPAEAARPPSAVGFVRSPFEPRVAVAIWAPGRDDGRGAAIHFFGARLDKRWSPSSPLPTAPPARK